MRNLFFSLVLRFFNLKKSAVPAERKGLVVILIDGLGYTELKHAIERNYCPFFTELLSGSCKLNRYYCGPPASTVASEAELFFGRRDNIPGFTWYDRDLGHFIRGNRGAGIEAFENAYEKPEQLLKNGSCILGVFNGGATQLGVSGKDMRTSPARFIRKLHVLVFIFLNPIRFAYTFYLIGKSLFFSLLTLIRKRSKKKVRPILAEAFNRIFLGNISTYVAELELVRETPVLFIDYLLYDEFAHEYGIGRRTTLSSLKLINSYCRSLYRITRKTARQYDFIILSDHGQTKAVPFEGLSAGRLERILEKAVPGYEVVRTIGTDNTDGKRIFLVPAGSTVQLYCSESLKKPLYRTGLHEKFPLLESVLLEDKQIGWLLIRENGNEQRLIGKDGSILFRNGEVVSRSGNPFPQGQPENSILESLAVYARYPNNGDIVIFGSLLPDGKLVAFEEHKSTHGGFIGEMVSPFIITEIPILLSLLKKDDNIKSLFAAIRQNAKG